MNNKASYRAELKEHVHTRLLSAMFLKLFGLLLALLGLSIVICNEAAVDSSEADSLFALFDVVTPAGFLTFLAGFLAAVTGCKDNRKLMIATVVVCWIAMVTDIKILASSARTITTIEKSSMPEQGVGHGVDFHDHKSAHLPFQEVLEKPTHAATSMSPHVAPDESSHESSHEAADKSPQEASHEATDEASHEEPHKASSEATLLHETSHEASHDQFQYPRDDSSDDANGKKRAKHTALVIMSLMSFIFLLAISILGGRALAKEAETDRHAVYSARADGVPLI